MLEKCRKEKQGEKISGRKKIKCSSCLVRRGNVEGKKKKKEFPYPFLFFFDKNRKGKKISLLFSV